VLRHGAADARKKDARDAADHGNAQVAKLAFVAQSSAAAAVCSWTI